MASAQVMSSLLSEMCPSEAPDPNDPTLDEEGKAGLEQDMKMKRGDTGNSEYKSKVGIGELGLHLITAPLTVGQKVLEKTCLFCMSKLGSADPLNCELTLAWFKPYFQGKVAIVNHVTPK